MRQKLFFICLLFALGSCGKEKPGFSGEKKPTVLVSIAPYRFFIEQIAGDVCTIQTIVPSVADPHTFEPTPAQANAISGGKIWFRIGEPFESQILPIIKKRNPELLIVDLRDGISLIEENSASCCGSKDHMDRHIWLSPTCAQQQAKTIETSLTHIFPEHEALFKKNRILLCENLSFLDLRIRQSLQDVQNRSILVSHPAFGYFCNDYDLTQLSVEFEGKEPRPQDVEKIFHSGQIEHIELALALPQHNNKGVQMIAKKLEAPVHFIDPYSENYFDTLETLTLLIKNPHAN